MLTKVLIVEDDEAIVTLLAYHLENEGYAVTHINSGTDAMSGIEGVRPDIVILDWMLPGLSGIEICRQIRARPNSQRCPSSC